MFGKSKKQLQRDAATAGGAALGSAMLMQRASSEITRLGGDANLAVALSRAASMILNEPSLSRDDR